MKKSLLLVSVFLSNAFYGFAATTVVGTVSTQTGVDSTPIIRLIEATNDILARLVPIAIGLAVLGFFWFLLSFIFKGKDEPAEQVKARAGMGYSILAIFLMVSIWGVIGLIGNVLGIGGGGSYNYPTIPGQPVKVP